QLFHFPTMALAGTAGGALLTLMTYLNLSAVGRIKAENFVAMTAFAPLSAWSFLELAAAAGWVTVRKVETNLLPAIVVLGVAVLLILHAARQRSRRQLRLILESDSTARASE